MNIARVRAGAGWHTGFTAIRRVMFGIGPAYLFFLQHRLPMGLMRGGWQPWFSAMATNLVIALIAAMLVWLIGIKAIPVRSSSDHAAGGHDRRVAVLCPTPV